MNNTLSWEIRNVQVFLLEKYVVVYERAVRNENHRREQQILKANLSAPLHKKKILVLAIMDNHCHTLSLSLFLNLVVDSLHPKL
jgi:hypothetical protein